MVKITVISCSIRPKGLEITQKGLEEQTFKDFEWVQEISLTNRGHDLNSSYNRALRRAKGELIVSLQDYIKVTPEFLQKYWDAYQEDKRTFFTAPVGKTKNEDYSPPYIWDWRAYKDAQCVWNTWEIDSGAAPLSALKEIGGFDEELDQYWSCDNVSVGCRANLTGYKFKHLFDNPAVAYDHDAFIKHPFREKFNPHFNAYRMRLFEMDELKLHYLD